MLWIYLPIGWLKELFRDLTQLREKATRMKITIRKEELRKIRRSLKDTDY